MKPGATWVEVFESLKDDHPPADRIKDEYQARMEAAQAYLKAHRIVTLPAGERVTTIDTPPAMRRSTTMDVFVDKLLRIGSLPPALVRAELLDEPIGGARPAVGSQADERSSMRLRLP
jgi:hypothetical protein